MYSNVKQILPLGFSTGILGMVKNLNLVGSNPQYFLELRKFYTIILLFSLHAKIMGTEASSYSGTFKFLFNLSNNSSIRVLQDFSYNGYINLSWNKKRLDEPAQRKKNAT